MVQVLGLIAPLILITIMSSSANTLEGQAINIRQKAGNHRRIFMKSLKYQGVRYSFFHRFRQSQSKTLRNNLFSGESHFLFVDTLIDDRLSQI